MQALLALKQNNDLLHQLSEQPFALQGSVLLYLAVAHGNVTDQKFSNGDVH